MNEDRLEQLLTNLGAVLHRALTSPSAMAADSVITVINGQLGPYLHAQAQAIAALQAEVKKLTPKP